MNNDEPCGESALFRLQGEKQVRNLEIDHMVPLRTWKVLRPNEDPNVASNLQVLCRKHNVLKKRLDDVQYADLIKAKST